MSKFFSKNHSTLLYSAGEFFSPSYYSCDSKINSRTRCDIFQSGFLPAIPPADTHISKRRIPAFYALGEKGGAKKENDDEKRKQWKGKAVG